jgi:uncharacterized membrane protein HdeD (DUF308 family)
METEMVESIHTPQAFDVDRMRTTLKEALHDHWKLFLFEGIALIALGAAAVAVPPLASLAVTVFVGWLLLVGGGIGLVAALYGHAMKGFWWALLSSALALAAGAILLWLPLRGILTLTLVLAAYFIADGVASIMLAIEHRHDESRAWGWLVASGIVDFILAGVIISGWPGTAAWVIGLIVGVDLMFAGWALVMIALRSRKAAA